MGSLELELQFTTLMFDEPKFELRAMIVSHCKADPPPQCWITSHPWQSETCAETTKGGGLSTNLDPAWDPPHVRGEAWPLSDWSSMIREGVWYEPIEKSTTRSDEGSSSFGQGQEAEDAVEVG